MYSKAVLDACVLIPYPLCDALLRLAEGGLYQPFWSQELLAETERNLIAKFSMDPTAATRRTSQMQRAFPLACVDDFADLIPGLTNHPKDRHVLAAAIRADADTIVTANLKDFLAQDLAGWGVRAIHPDAFLQELLAADPDRVITCLHEQRRAYAKPRFSVEEFYESLSPTVPQFAVLARGFDREQDRNQIPLPLEIVPGGEAYAAFFPDGEPDLATPLGAGFLWWSALLHRDQFLSELESLSYDADDWGDYEWAAAELEGRALLQGVRSCDDAPDEIAYLIFMPDSGHAMRAFGEAPIADAWVLTVVRAKDGFWRAWGLSNNYYPSADRIRHGTDD